jgi:hypothetical protein
MSYKIFWGDIHNHNSMGYARGSLERSIDIARNSLDFFATTGQCQWHDMEKYESNVHMHWVNGFKAHNENWPKIQEAIKKTNEDGKFVAFIGYEFHSSMYGDYCIIFPDDNSRLEICDGIDSFKKLAKETGALIIPHHLGYKRGHRGFNIDVFDDNYSPVVEIYSEHGCSERDGGPYEMITHSMGARTTENTLQNILSKGYKVGVVASSDDHLGYPGAYGEGLVAVLAESLDRKSIFEAIKSRRTYAVTGDRIKLDFSLNGNVMGSVLDYAEQREISAFVDGWDEILMIEVVKNNEVIHRHFPERKVGTGSEKIKTRIEYGWGPWNDLSIPRICDWDISLSVFNAKITDYCICFQSGPFSEEKRNKIIRKDDNRCDWISYTSRDKAFMHRATNSIVFEIEGNGQINLDLFKPVKMQISALTADLTKESVVEFTGPFPKESVKIHKAVPESLYKTSFKYIDNGDGNKEDFYYLRVTQLNGQMAWSSPIWVKGKQ